MPRCPIFDQKQTTADRSPCNSVEIKAARQASPGIPIMSLEYPKGCHAAHVLRVFSSTIRVQTAQVAPRAPHPSTSYNYQGKHIRLAAAMKYECNRPRMVASASRYPSSKLGCPLQPSWNTPCTAHPPALQTNAPPVRNPTRQMRTATAHHNCGGHCGDACPNPVLHDWAVAMLANIKLEPNPPSAQTHKHADHPHISQCDTM